MRILTFWALSLLLFHGAVTAQQEPGDIFLLHGSFSNACSWYQPGGLFYEALQKAAHKYKEISPTQQVIPHSWSGGFMHKELINDGFDFAEHLLRESTAHKNGGRITLIAHSNGGAVSLFCTMIIAEMHRQRTQEKNATRHFHIPVNLYEPFMKRRKTKSPGEGHRFITAEIEAQITARYNNLYALYGHHPDCTLLTTPFPIKALYLMGTPINTNRFPVSTDAIEHVYNMTSGGDFVQSLAGKKVVPNHERCWNIHVSLHEPLAHCEICNFDEDDEGEIIEREGPVEPCHECIHAPLTAQWLFELPKLIMQLSTNFNNGELVLHPIEKPILTPLDTSAEER